MQPPGDSILRFVGGGLLAAGTGWLLWVCFLGVALRDGIAQAAASKSTRAAFEAFVTGAWHMLLPGVLVALLGWTLMRRASRKT